MTLAFAGCQLSYDIETTLGPDGSGDRTVTLETHPGEFAGAGVTVEQVRTLFGLEEARGWRAAPRPDDDELAFICQQQVRDLEGWSALDCAVEIRGALVEGPLADVRFREEVTVETGHGPGGRTLTYRATYRWDRLKEVLMNRIVGHFDAAVARRYAFLDKVQRAELRGLLAGHLAVVLLAETGESCSLADEAITASFMDLAGPIVRAARPTADLAPLAEIVRETGEGDWLFADLPGVQLAALGAVEVRVTLPGEVLETDGDQVDARTVRWEFGIEQVLREPVTIRAHAAVATRPEVAE
jgi:hypothetical protein